MKIIIKADSKKYSIKLPLFLIKSKIVQKAIVKYSNNQIREFIKLTYKEIKKFIKENGHFVFISFKEKDGMLVKIVL